MELFRCERLNARLSKRACARQHHVANDPDTSTPERIRLSQCRDCDVGEGHEVELGGQPTPKGQTVTLIQKFGYNDWIEYKGKNQTLAVWARELGLTTAALQWRFRQGWSVEKCLTTLPGPARGQEGRTHQKPPRTPRVQAARIRKPRKAKPVSLATDAYEIHKGTGPRISYETTLVPTSKGTGPKALLELAGYTVHEVTTPKGILLLVGPV